jgi:hypothetical protein
MISMIFQECATPECNASPFLAYDVPSQITVQAVNEQAGSGSAKMFSASEWHCWHNHSSGVVLRLTFPTLDDLGDWHISVGTK